MLKPIEMDENVTLAAQLEEQKNGRSVILINKFNVKPEDVDQLLNAWTADAGLYLKQKPGLSPHSFIGALEEVACLSITLYGSL
ncbi:MAG TPA: hypothetical protein VFZ67_05030 [Nitrososphaera sp.]|jgi:hypothetical protein